MNIKSAFYFFLYSYIFYFIYSFLWCSLHDKMTNFNEISFLNILLWAVFGAFIGLVAHLQDKSEVSGGIIATMIFGCLGAVISGYMTSFLLGKAMLTFNAGGLVLSGLGALFIALFYRVSFREHMIQKTNRERNE